MSAAAEPEFVAETLAWCNERRAERGKKPLKRLPKGQRWDSESCPCGKATGLFVGRTRFGATREALSESVGTLLPFSVQTFVSAFDLGALPQYDEAATS